MPEEFKALPSARADSSGTDVVDILTGGVGETIVLMSLNLSATNVLGSSPGRGRYQISIIPNGDVPGPEHVVEEEDIGDDETRLFETKVVLKEGDILRLTALTNDLGATSYINAHGSYLSIT